MPAKFDAIVADDDSARDAHIDSRVTKPSGKPNGFVALRACGLRGLLWVNVHNEKFLWTTPISSARPLATNNAVTL
jgi:hypothetical protein